MKKVSNIKMLIVCSICCTITCIFAMFTINIGVVPITLATFAVYLSGALLGPIYGAISQILYLVLVFVGLPFTSKGSAGPSYFVGPTAGYMFGYVVMAFLLGYVYKTFGKKASKYEYRMMWLFIGAIIGTISCYFFGTVWFVLQNEIEFSKALKICVYPFLIGDFLKILIAAMVVPSIEKALDL